MDKGNSAQVVGFLRTTMSVRTVGLIVVRISGNNFRPLI